MTVEANKLDQTNSFGLFVAHASIKDLKNAIKEVVGAIMHYNLREIDMYLKSVHYISHMYVLLYATEFT